MRDYTLLIEDDRYSVPTLVIVDTEDDESAEEIALQRLRESSHHLSVELHLEDELIFRCERVGGPGK